MLLNVITGYTTIEECEDFVYFAQSLLDLIKELKTNRFAEQAVAKKMLAESIEKANEWWLSHGGLETIPEDLR